VFATISAAMAASHDGDTIQIQAGTYTNDTAKITTSITLQATGGRVLMRETVPLANQKGILIVGTQTAAATVRIDGFEFAGASTPYGNNGAGIRYQNGNPTLTNDYFHNNQDGILATPWQPGTGTLLIDHSEFAYNGTGDGYTHNIYVGDIDSFTLRNSYSHDTAEGHEVKSRAENTTIANNRIFDNGSTSSYSIDLPNGGNATILIRANARTKTASHRRATPAASLRPEAAISAFGRPHRGSRCATRVAPRPPGDGRPGSQEAMTRGEALDDRGALARRISARAS
jgi:hypothetical protein